MLPYRAMFRLVRLLAHPRFACYKFIDLLTKIVKVAQFAHMLRFFASNSSRNLSEWIVGVRLVKTK